MLDRKLLDIKTTRHIGPKVLYWLLKLYFQTGFRGIFALSYRNPSSYGSCCDARTRSLPGRPHVRPLFAVCLSVYLSVCLCVCVCTWSIVRPRPYVYIVGLHLPQGAPAYVGSDNAQPHNSCSHPYLVRLRPLNRRVLLCHPIRYTMQIKRFESIPYRREPQTNAAWELLCIS